MTNKQLPAYVIQEVGYMLGRYIALETEEVQKLDKLEYFDIAVERIRAMEIEQDEERKALELFSVLFDGAFEGMKDVKGETGQESSEQIL